MKISTRGRYGLRALVDIAAYTQSGDTYVNLKSVAERNGLSEGYLEQLIIPLKKADLVKSIRGSQGGYTLGRSASDISVAEVLKVLEGSLYPVDCVADDHSACSTASCENCVTKSVWERLYSNVNSVLGSIKLSELVQEYWEVTKSVEP